MRSVTQLAPLKEKREMTAIDAREETLTANFGIQFWGVRGQVAIPGQDTLRYGGNTSCVEIRAKDKLLIFDGGTGLRQLGNHLLGQMPLEAHLFFSGYNWDRIQGFPFFVPGFIPINHFSIYGAGITKASPFKERLQAQMLGPNFPVPLQIMRSQMEFQTICEDRTYGLDDVEIEAKLLETTYPAIAYRLHYRGKSVAYATQTQSLLADNTGGLRQLTEGVDLAILDVPRFWRGKDCEASCLAWLEEVRAKQVLLSMYAPEDDDDYLDRVAEQLQAIAPHVSLAREGAIISV